MDCRRVQSKIGYCNIGSVNTYRICGRNVIAPKFVDLEIADHDDRPFPRHGGIHLFLRKRAEW